MSNNIQQRQPFVYFVADCLDERQSPVISTIGRIVASLGTDVVKELLKETLEIEQRGGMLTADGSRRRTVGGVFFYLVKQHYGEQLPPDIWPLSGTRRRKPGTNTATSTSVNPPQPQLTPFAWEERIDALKDITAEERGTLSTVKITLIGRPGRIIDKGQCIITTLKDEKLPSLPKGLPTPASTTQNYTLYVAAKQWRKVAEAIADPGDSLIVEGYPQMDSNTSSIAVFATNITTKKLQAAKKKTVPGE